MILPWMLYSVVLAAMLGAAALLVDGALRDSGRQTRWVWVAAAVTMLAISYVALLVTPIGVIYRLIPGPESAPWLARPALSYIKTYESLMLWDAYVATALWSASLVVGGVFVLSIARLAARRRSWQRSVVDGARVLVSDRDGPAVVGFLSGTIVLPRWVVTESERLRSLIVMHETEHLRAGDARLILLAAVLVIAQPWNPLAWWIAWRLRLAIEVDCDARVLRHGPDVHTYGMLLLEVGTRAPFGGVAAAFSTPTSALEKRLRIMTSRVPTGRRVIARLALAAGLVVTTAAFLPEPGSLHCTFEALGFTHVR
jgi:beta-lactamase regulating signal transducer with metallopeptidase domain